MLLPLLFLLFWTTAVEGKTVVVVEGKKIERFSRRFLQHCLEAAKVKL
jgi:hypothetical protein